MPTPLTQTMAHEAGYGLLTSHYWRAVFAGVCIPDGYELCHVGTDVKEPFWLYHDGSITSTGAMIVEDHRGAVLRKKSEKRIFTEEMLSAVGYAVRKGNYAFDVIGREIPEGYNIIAVGQELVRGDRFMVGAAILTCTSLPCKVCNFNAVHLRPTEIKPSAPEAPQLPAPKALGKTRLERMLLGQEPDVYAIPEARRDAENLHAQIRKDFDICHGSTYAGLSGKEPRVEEQRYFTPRKNGKL